MDNIYMFLFTSIWKADCRKVEKLEFLYKIIPTKQLEAVVTS